MEFEDSKIDSKYSKPILNATISFYFLLDQIFSEIERTAVHTVYINTHVHVYNIVYLWIGLDPALSLTLNISEDSCFMSNAMATGRFKSPAMCTTVDP